VQFRRLFREDDDFHGARPRAQRDNWLVGREVLVEAQGWVDQEGLPIKGKNPILFHCDPVMCLVNYADALEEEGTFGEVAKNAWQKASQAWQEYANRDLPTQDNVFMRLGDKERYDERAKESQEQLEKLLPEGARDKIFAEKLAALPEEQREIYETPPEQRTSEQNAMMYVIDGSLKISHLELAERVPAEQRAAALKLAEEATLADNMSLMIDIDRGIVNFNYWTRRCQVEPLDTTLDARKAIYDADKAFTAAKLPEARDLYEKGWQNWRAVIDANNLFVEDAIHVEELCYSIANYIALLHQLEERLPQPFVLQDVLDANEKFTGRTVPGSRRTQAEEADPSQQPLPPQDSAPTEPMEPTAPLTPATDAG
jgi:hypothetical protein